MNPKMLGKILCINSEKLFEKGKWEGFKTDDLDYYYSLLRDSSEFRVRQELENDPSYKQIITQVIFKYKDKYFLHRQNKANETRLNSMCPLPIGGHVEVFDVKEGEDVLQVALDREVAEEIEFHANIIKKDFLGLVFLDDNDVNRVHVGLMYVFELDGDDVKMIDEGLETIGWVDKEYLNSHMDELTYWSKLFVEEYLT